jgi:glutamate 5-kinase
MSNRKELLKDIERVYTKIGANLLMGWDGRLDETQFYHLAKELSTIYKNGVEVIHTTSGAIRAGMQAMDVDNSVYKGLDEKQRLTKEQGYAAVGQPILMSIYCKYFVDEFKQQIAQLLPVSKNFTDPEEVDNFINCYKNLKENRVIPIVNNNDPFSVKELGGYSENDALLADLVLTLDKKLPKKTLVIILSEYCLHTEDPRKKDKHTEPIHIVEEITDEIRGMAGKVGEYEMGGMKAKLDAAEKITKYGKPVIIVDGKYRKGHENIIIPILEGKEIGTLFLPKKR